MSNKEYEPTSYFFDSKKWSSNFNGNERNESSRFNDGVIIGTLLREIDEKYARLVKKYDGISEYELLSYQQCVTVELLIAIKEGNLIGDPDAVLETLHESVQLCIKQSAPRFIDYQPQGVYQDLHYLASSRVYLEKQWEKIKYSKWSFRKEGSDLVLYPSEREVDFGEKIAVKRFEDHLLQLSEKAILEGGFVDPRIKVLPEKVFKKNDGFGIRFDYPSKKSAIQHQLIFNQYPYFYMAYNNTPLKKYPEIQLLDIRYFWIVFSSLSHCIIKEFLSGESISLPVIFSKEKLVNMITRCIDLKASQAEQLVDLHTNTKKELTDFYLKPLYKTGDDYFISLGVFAGGQMTRVIDEVVKTELNTKKLNKGKFFERFFKNLISKQMSSNEILQKGFCRVLALGFKQTRGKKNEEIDIVIRIGETYLLIEVKSFVYRIGTTGYHNNLKEMKESNAKQKINFFIDEHERFKAIYDQDANFELKRDNVIFCYLTSVPHATGVRVNNMPVVDSSILERYFGQGNFELRNEKNESKNFIFYDSFEEAERNLKRYLENPPQLQPFKNSFIYKKSDHVMNLNGMNVSFQEALFELNEGQEEHTSLLWSSADYWHR